MIFKLLGRAKKLPPPVIPCPPRIILEIDLQGREHTPGNLRRALQYADAKFAEVRLEPSVQTLMVVEFLGRTFATIFVRSEDYGGEEPKR